MDLPAYLPNGQFEYLIEALARKPFELFEVQSDFERLWGRKVEASVLMNLKKDYKDQIDAKRLEIYEDINSLPLAHSFPIIALCQSRIEDLVKTPKTIRQNRRIDEKGQEYIEDEKAVDDAAITKYLTICQNERFGTLKLEIAKIVNEVDKTRLPRTGFKPVVINTGFSDGEEE